MREEKGQDMSAFTLYKQDNGEAKLVKKNRKKQQTSKEQRRIRNLLKKKMKK